MKPYMSVLANKISADFYQRVRINSGCYFKAEKEIYYLLCTAKDITDLVANLLMHELFVIKSPCSHCPTLPVRIAGACTFHPAHSHYEHCIAGKTECKTPAV